VSLRVNLLGKRISLRVARRLSTTLRCDVCSYHVQISQSLAHRRRVCRRDEKSRGATVSVAANRCITGSENFPIDLRIFTLGKSSPLMRANLAKSLKLFSSRGFRAESPAFVGFPSFFLEWKSARRRIDIKNNAGRKRDTEKNYGTRRPRSRVIMERINLKKSNIYLISSEKIFKRFVFFPEDPQESPARNKYVMISG